MPWMPVLATGSSVSCPLVEIRQCILEGSGFAKRDEQSQNCGRGKRSRIAKWNLDEESPSPGGKDLER